MYKAFDLELEQTVVINVLFPHLRTPEGKRQFRACLARAREQSSPQAHDYGDCNGVTFVTVEYLEGVGAAVDISKF